jgi:hypothetical protein
MPYGVGGAPWVLGLNAIGAIAPRYARNAAAHIVRAAGVSRKQIEGLATRMLLRDCAADLSRLEEAIDRELLNPVRRAAAEEALAVKTRAAQRRLRERRLRRFLSMLVPQAVEDGLEHGDLIDVFNFAVVAQVMNS